MKVGLEFLRLNRLTLRVGRRALCPFVPERLDVLHASGLPLSIMVSRHGAFRKSTQTSSLQTNGAGGNVVSSKTERHTGEIPDEYGQISKTRMPQQIYCTTIESGGYDAWSDQR
jgi:hypothetical protein